MPHIIVKMYPGRSETQKQALCDRIVADVVEVAQCEASSVSVGIEEISREDWAKRVYKPDIEGKKETLYKLPGYPPPTLD